MVCVFCSREKNLLFPVPHRQLSGLSAALGCQECAEERGLWCHTCGWAKTPLLCEGEPVCLYCVENEFAEKYHKADSVRESLQTNMGLDAWMDLAEKATHQPLYVDEGLNHSILRFLIIKAHIEGTRVEEVIKNLCSEPLPLQVQAQA